MRRSSGSGYDSGDDSDSGYMNFTYRPLSRLPTPPPTFNDNDISLHDLHLDDYEDAHHREPLNGKYRGPAIHLINLIPSSASFANASVPLVQSMLARAALPIETVALAVCILDSLDAKFGRQWRLSCPSLVDGQPLSSIDSVRPEIIVLAALVIAAKFDCDDQLAPHVYRVAWGRGLWSARQMAVTERCIMESLDYRIMPLCDEDCLTDAMVDMQLAARLDDVSKSTSSDNRWQGIAACEPTPPASAEGSECEFALRSET